MKDFLTLAAERYSVRKYSDRPVEQEKIEAILEAAKLAPTACNAQPQRIYAVQSEEMRKVMAEVTPGAYGAPVIFVIGYDVTRSPKGMICEGYDFGETDAAIVATHMTLAAADLGLGSCCVGYFNEENLKARLQLPENVRVRLVLPVGYAAEDAKPASLHTQYRPMDEMVAFL